MKVCGWEIKKMVRDLKFIKIRELIEAILRIINLMAKVFIHIRMEKFMMVIGLKGKKLGLEFGKDFMMILIWENGLIIKFMVLVFINGLTGIGMKVNGKIH
jgi:hypothetical protein